MTWAELDWTILERLRQRFLNGYPKYGNGVEAVDRLVEEVVSMARGACALHQLEPDGSPNTAHSLNPVPLIVTLPDLTLVQQGGVLADVAPTMLELLGIPHPPEMTGNSLITAQGD